MKKLVAILMLIPCLLYFVGISYCNECPLRIESIKPQRNDYRQIIWYNVLVQSTKDFVKIIDVKYDRGNMEFAGKPEFPIYLKFGELANIPAKGNPLEITIETDSGNCTFRRN